MYLYYLVRVNTAPPPAASIPELYWSSIFPLPSQTCKCIAYRYISHLSPSRSYHSCTKARGTRDIFSSSSHITSTYSNYHVKPPLALYKNITITQSSDTAMEQKGIKIVYWNLQRLLNKTDSVRLAVNELSPHILCASETWLKEETPDSLVNIHGYEIIRNDHRYLNNIGSVTKGRRGMFLHKREIFVPLSGATRTKLFNTGHL